MSMESVGSVYRAFCTTTGKSYVGQTWGNIGKRWENHQKPSSECPKLKNAILRHGADSFDLTLLTYVNTQTELDEAEIYWINFLDCMEDGYNVTAGGSGHRHPHSPQTKEKIRISNTGKKRSPEALRKFVAALKGRKHGPMSSENKRLISLAKGGRRLMDEEGRIYNSLSEAAEILGLERRGVRLVAEGKWSQYRGHKFRFLENK